MKKEQRIQRFIEKASSVSARVVRVKTREEALAEAFGICLSKPPLEPQTDHGKAKDPGSRIMAAPNLGQDGFDTLSRDCEGKGDVLVIRDGLRQYPGGIDVGVTLADYGIAETGTLVLNSNLEDVRLCSMLCEVHVAILRESAIKEPALSMEEQLYSLMDQKGAYTAFITGASRTADIERVLTIGVHGPLELVIILEEG